MNRTSITAGELIAKLEADAEFQKKKAEREAKMAVIFEQRKKDQAGLVAELREAGFNIDSVYDFVNTREKYPEALPILIRHLDLPHEPIIRGGIVRSLTINYGGLAVEEALLRHFQNEVDHNLRWVFANALKTAMPLARRKKYPDIEAVFSRNSPKKKTANQAAQTTPGLRPSVSDL